jgi:hypothetical protein
MPRILFEAEDGTTFSTEAEAIKYEKNDPVRRVINDMWDTEALGPIPREHVAFVLSVVEVFRPAEPSLLRLGVFGSP